MVAKSAAMIGTLMLLSTVVASPALAGDQTGKVVLVGGDTGNPFVFTVSGPRNSRPACATDDNWAIPNPSTDNAKGLLSMVLTAFAAGKTISVHGNGNCNTTFPNREEVASFFIQ